MITMPAQHFDVCQPSAMDNGIVYQPNLSSICLFLLHVRPESRSLIGHIKFKTVVDFD